LRQVHTTPAWSDRGHAGRPDRAVDERLDHRPPDQPGRRIRASPATSPADRARMATAGWPMPSPSLPPAREYRGRTVTARPAIATQQEFEARRLPVISPGRHDRCWPRRNCSLLLRSGDQNALKVKERTQPLNYPDL
jgi:hypothetical protein